MGSKPATTREAILDTAYERAQAQGVAALDIRSVARECGVAVGTIYNYFPDMAALRTEVVQRFWACAIERADLNACAREGGTALDYCRRLAQSLGTSLKGFRANWLREISAIDGRTRQRTQEAELACFQTICDGIRRALEEDQAISAAARDRLDSGELAHFIWRSMFDAIRTGDVACSALFEVLELALYR